VPASERTRVAAALDAASVDAFRAATALAGILMLIGGAVSAVGVRDPRREVAAAECPGGAIFGAARDAGQEAPAPAPAPAR
jgi:hypothetical protein